MENSKETEELMSSLESSSRRRVDETSTIMIKQDDKWVWLDTGKEVENPPAK